VVVRVRGRVLVAGSLIVLGVVAALLQARDSRPDESARSVALRLALLRAAGGEADRASSEPGASKPGVRSLVRFPRGTPAAAVAKPANGVAFGQPTIAGVAGWGFEPDLRSDPADPHRIYMSAPDSVGPTRAGSGARSTAGRPSNGFRQQHH